MQNITQTLDALRETRNKARNAVYAVAYSRGPGTRDKWHDALYDFFVAQQNLDRASLGPAGQSIPRKSQAEGGV